MSSGKVVGIYISLRRGEPTVWVEQIHAVPGCGIEGDRYFKRPGTPDDHPKTGRQVTLIEMEAIEAMVQDGIIITPGQTRRNIITRGVSLNSLVDREFSVGSIRLLGVRLCEPCDYLASQTDPRILHTMSHRGGLRADILTDGLIYLNDLITTSLQE